MLNCLIDCVTFSASDIVKPQWWILNVIFVFFLSSSIKSHVNRSVWHVRTFLSETSTQPSRLLRTRSLDTFDFAAFRHLFSLNLRINIKQNIAAYKRSNVGDLSLYAYLESFIDDTEFLLLYVSSYCR